jgi:hypothetical protein
MKIQKQYVIKDIKNVSEYSSSDSLPRAECKISSGQKSSYVPILKIPRPNRGTSMPTSKKERPADHSENVYVVAAAIPAPDKIYPMVPEGDNPRFLKYNPNHEQASTLFKTGTLFVKKTPLYESIIGLYKVFSNTSEKEYKFIMENIDVSKINGTNAFSRSISDNNIYAFGNPIVMMQANAIKIVFETPQIARLVDSLCKRILSHGCNKASEKIDVDICDEITNMVCDMNKKNVENNKDLIV